jgi:hypothetical protein
VSNKELAIDQKDVGLDARESLFQSIHQGPRVVIVVVSMGLRKRTDIRDCLTYDDGRKKNGRKKNGRKKSRQGQRSQDADPTCFWYHDYNSLPTIARGADWKT